jgi:Tol biopolymer transport system component
MAVLAAMLIGASAASAAFPGRDGVIAFSSTKEDGEDCPVGHDDSVFEPCVYSIFRVRSSGSGQKRLSSCGSRVQPACEDESPAWSPGGSKLLFSRGGEIWLMNADGSGERRLGLEGSVPRWAPDARHVLFSRDGELTIARLDGTVVRTLARGRIGDSAWSTRGLIAYKRFTDEGADLYTIKPDGTARRRIVRNCRCGGPEFSPDGRRFLYTIGAGSRGVYTATLEGLSRRRLISDAIDGDWSPSGRFLVFVRSNDIWVARSDGKEQRRVADNAKRLPNDITGDYFEPSWQPLPRR